MKYNSIKELPPVLHHFPVVAQNLFLGTHNELVSRGNSESTAFKGAWNIVKSRLEQRNGEWVARAGAFKTTTFYAFNANKAEEFVTRTEDGHLIHNYILSDTLPDGLGTSPTEELLMKWADWINSVQPSIDTDHQLWDAALKAYGGDKAQIEKAMSAKQGIAKAQTASVVNGQLQVSLLFDKRYEKHMDKIKGLSVEAAVTRDEITNKWEDGHLFGFTLAENINPVNPRAVRVTA